MMRSSKVEDSILEPRVIHNLSFKNRLLRSSIGGRTCNYDGTVTDVWKNFEKRFADGGVGGIISTTFHVNEKRLSPLQYPSLAAKKYLPYLKKYIPLIRDQDGVCRYIIQIGDPGYTTYTSLLPDRDDGISASDGFDLAFGYNNRRYMMSDSDIQSSISDYAAAAARVRESGADGVEITATKGYLIHQFLNPGINLRTDAWGGDEERRFHFLEQIMRSVRAAVGDDFLLGVRISGADHNTSPRPLSALRLPSLYGSRLRRRGNDLEQMIRYAGMLKDLKADYLHVVAGYGFPNPRDVPGYFPFEEIRMFFDSVRHLSTKAAVRAGLVHLGPTAFWRWFLNIGWKPGEAVNLDYAQAIKNAVGMPVIANGGFEGRSMIAHALRPGGCDFVSMARALIANPDLVHQFERGAEPPAEKRCSQCNRCVGRTTTSPLGCYDLKRFESEKEMLAQILEFNEPDPA
jgi:2,4-dienoyl-CoA reductase-like NADH-dependent reductase (Old Yellow Enzyme family)